MSGPFKALTHGRYTSVVVSAATVRVVANPAGPVTVTLTGTGCTLATTAVKSKPDQTTLAVTVGQNSQPRYDLEASASAQVAGSVVTPPSPWLTVPSTP